MQKFYRCHPKSEHIYKKHWGQREIFSNTHFLPCNNYGVDVTDRNMGGRKGIENLYSIW